MANNTVYIKHPGATAHRLTNDTGADLAKNELSVIGKLVVVAAEAVASAAVGSFDTEDGGIIQADDLKTTEDTFGTVGQAVYFDPSSGEFSDTATVGYYEIGQLVTAQDADGMIEFIRMRWANEIESDET